MSGTDSEGSHAAAVARPHSMLMEVKRLLKHSAVYGIGNILSKLVGFLLIPVYTRYLSPADYGVVEILDLTLYFISMIVGMGLSSAVLRFYYEVKEQKEKDCIVSTATLFVSALAISTAMICVLFDDQISIFLFKTNTKTLFFDLMIVGFFFSTLIEIPLVLLRAQERSVVFTAVTLLRLVLALSLNIYFIVIVRWGVTGFLVSQLATSVIISLILVISTLGKARITFSLKYLKKMALFSLPLIPSSLGMFVINFGDRFVLQHYHSDWDVGLYSLGYKFAFMISQLIGQPFFLIWSARMYQVIEMKDGEKMYARFATYFAMIITFAGLGMVLIIPDVMKIVPSAEFFSAHKVVPILVMAYFFREMSDYFRGILFIEKKTTRVGLTMLLTTSLCVVLYMVFIPAWGVNGAALATLLTFCFMAFCMLYFAQRARPIPYEYMRILMLVVVAAGIYLVFRSAWSFNPYLDLVLKGGLAFVYLPLLYVLGFFTDQEKAKIKAGLSKVGAVLKYH